MYARELNFWVVAKLADDVPGEWVAHCLEVDVVTQGRSLRHAIEMAAEAVVMVVSDDIKAGRQPTDRRAPEEFWAELWDLLDRGSKDSLDLTGADSAVSVAAQLLVHVVRLPEGTFPASRPVRPISPPPLAEPHEQWKVPALWRKPGRNVLARA